MSTRFDFAMARKASEAEYGLESGGYFKPKEGANKMRILSHPPIYVSEFKGRKTVKYVCWIFDYSDNKVKLYFMPATLYKAVEALQTNEEYHFEELPMPYDITVMAQDPGTKEVKYQLTPARENTPLTQECEAQLVGRKSIEEVIAKLKEKDAGTQSTEPEYESVDEEASGYDAGMTLANADTKQKKERAEIAKVAKASTEAKNIASG